METGRYLNYDYHRISLAAWFPVYRTISTDTINNCFLNAEEVQRAKGAFAQNDFVSIHQADETKAICKVDEGYLLGRGYILVHQKELYLRL